MDTASSFFHNLGSDWHYSSLKNLNRSQPNLYMLLHRLSIFYTLLLINDSSPSSSCLHLNFGVFLLVETAHNFRYDPWGRLSFVALLVDLPGPWTTGALRMPETAQSLHAFTPSLYLLHAFANQRLFPLLLLPPFFPFLISSRLRCVLVGGDSPQLSLRSMGEVEFRCFVGGLAWATYDRSLENAFRNFGEILESKVISDRDTGRSCGFGFVTFADEQEMKEVIESMYGKELDGRNITVNQAQSSSGGGGSGGYGGSKYGGGAGGGGGYESGSWRK